MKLLIVSNMPHYVKRDEIFGWGPTVEELNHLATLFEAVSHIAPVYDETISESSLPYKTSNLDLIAVTPAGGNRWIDKLRILMRIPEWLTVMCSEMRRADAVHIRCPAGISLIALIAVRLWARGKPIWVKYAGNWQPKGREPISYSLQRLLLKQLWQKQRVTVNGQWPAQPEHVITFNNPSLSEKDLTSARKISKGKVLAEPVQLLFVGRIELEKGVGRVIEVARGLKQRNISFHINLVGDGPQAEGFKKQVDQEGLEKVVTFTGWKSKDEVAKYYKSAHFILHPSRASEGWPKVLSEAMAYGVVPLASTVSSIPQILGQTGAGLAIPAEDTQTYIEAIMRYTQNIRSWKAASLNGIQAAHTFSYQYYLSAVRTLFWEAWNLDLNDE